MKKEKTIKRCCLCGLLFYGTKHKMRNGFCCDKCFIEKVKPIRTLLNVIEKGGI